MPHKISPTNFVLLCPAFFPSKLLEKTPFELMAQYILSSSWDGTVVKLFLTSINSLELAVGHFHCTSSIMSLILACLLRPESFIMRSPHRSLRGLSGCQLPCQREVFIPFPTRTLILFLILSLSFKSFSQNQGLSHVVPSVESLIFKTFTVAIPLLHSTIKALVIKLFLNLNFF